MIDDRVNIKRILMNLRWEILNFGILLTPTRRYTNNECFIPSFSSRVYIYYKEDNIYIKINKHIYKMPAEFDNGKISEKIIDAAVGIIRYHKADSRIKF